MALGGGTFRTFTKVLPGVYTNVRGSKVIKDTPTRGYVAVAIPLKWGEKGFVTVEADTIEEVCLNMFGYTYTDVEMTWLREIIAGGAKIIYVYNSNSEGVKAAGTYCTAKAPGSRGNDIKISIDEQADKTFNVVTYIGTTPVDEQNVATYSDLTSNAFVEFDKEVELNETAQAALSGGTDGTTAKTAHETFLNACECKYINVVICNSIEDTVKTLYKEYAVKYVEETALKVQVVFYQKDADFYGSLNVYHPAKASGVLGEKGYIFWYAGAVSGLLPNQCLTNKEYTGELETDVIYTNEQLETHIRKGHLVFNVVNEQLTVAKEVNSLTTFTDEFGEGYSLNQHIRIINDILTEQSNVLNEKHLGNTLPDDNGIGSIYSDLFEVLKRANQNSYLELPVSSDLVLTKVSGKKAALCIEQQFVTKVCLDTFYINTTAD